MDKTTLTSNSPGKKVSTVDITAHPKGGLSISLSHPMGSDGVPSSTPPAVPSSPSPTPPTVLEEPDPKGGKWVSVIPMQNARSEHTATSFPDGEVLVVGGRNDQDYLNTAELMTDLLVDNWISTSSMSGKRDFHTATLLNNGQVLVAGGRVSVAGGGILDSTGSALSTAELYDFKSQTWSQTGALKRGRDFHTATLLNNGQVLAAGGVDISDVLSTAELYDFKSQTWSQTTGDLNQERVAHTATLLNNGQVLAAGGADKAGSPLSTAELYDPNSGTWRKTTDTLSQKRLAHTATLLNNGQVLVVGGCVDIQASTSLSTAELYDPSTETWSQVGDMKEARAFHTATLLNNGQVLVAGGYDGDSLITAELYDPSTETWSQVGDMKEARAFHTATFLNNGQVLAAGGSDRVVGGGNVINTAELYDPNSKTWSQTTGDLNQERFTHTATLLNNGQVLIAGGQDKKIPLATAELYSLLDVKWELTSPMKDKRSYHTVTLLDGDNQVLVAGGQSADKTLVSGVEIYDRKSKTWTSTTPMKEVRAKHGMVRLLDGNILVAGGVSQDASGDKILSTVALYDVQNKTWNDKKSMSVERQGFTFTLLTDGKVLAAGGFSNTGSLLTAEIYDPKTDVWTATPNMNFERRDHSAVLLPNGNVLVVGGPSDAALIAEIYNPDTGTWSTTHEEPQEIGPYNTATLVGGEVVVTGGQMGPASLKTSQCYDSVNDKWVLLEFMGYNRAKHTAVLLSGSVLSGAVLVAGGNVSPNNPLSDVEIYIPQVG